MKHIKLYEAFIGPFVFNDSMSDEELLGMYNGALDGYANYAKGMHYAKSDYKKAYQEIEKILKKRGITVTENVTPATIGGMGPVVLPMSGIPGSGDVPAGSGDAEEEYKKKKKKRMKFLKTLEAYSQDEIIEEATDINDPVLVAMRAMKSTMAAKKAQAALDKKKRVYGKQRDVLEDQLWDIANELKDLTSERSQLYRDMESEAGEMGTEWSDEDANRYGGELNAIEDRIDALKTKRKQIEDRLSY